MTNTQVKLNQSRRDLKLTASKTIKAQLQSDLVMQFNKLNQLSQQNQNNNELNLLDNIVMNAIQTQSKFLQDLDNSIVGDTQESPNTDMQRPYPTQHQNDLFQQNENDFDVIQNDNQFRTGDDLDINMLNDNFRTGDEINIDSPEVAENLLLSKTDKTPKQQRQPERQVTKKPAKQRQKHFQLVLDELKGNDNEIQVEGNGIVNVAMMDVDQYFNKQNDIINIIRQSEPGVEQEENQNLQLNSVNFIESQLIENNATDQMVSSKNFNISGINFDAPQDIKELQGATDIRMLADSKQELIQRFMEVLQLYHNEQVILIQNEQARTIFVQNCLTE